MKGQVMDFSTVAQSGIISGEDGKQYSFLVAEWKGAQPPTQGQSVDFNASEGNAAGIYFSASPGPNPTSTTPGGDGGDRVVSSSTPKDPILMAVLSGCCIAGLGQMLLGQLGKGFAFLGAAIVLGVLTGGLSFLATGPAFAIDAYLIAKKLKEGKSVGKWECF
ncbi:MAG: hypothetical protein JJU11_03705 [Candidatus Sumerlaeia bacterium]|nr:hypothetical protein [Candidatus Sumerlaeia bacterium]